MFDLDSPLIKTMLKASGVCIDADQADQIVYIHKGDDVIKKTYAEFVAEIVKVFGGKILNVVTVEERAESYELPVG